MFLRHAIYMYAHTETWKLFNTRIKEEEWRMMMISEGEEERSYARRSIIGAQFLQDMRALRSLRAFSISLRYSASTFIAICQDFQRAKAK